MPITYRNMPIYKTAYQRDVEIIEAHSRDRFIMTALAVGLVFLFAWVVGL